jgi:hypothetical protein
VAFVNGQTVLSLPASFTLNNITINKNNATTVFFNTTSSLVASGTLSLTDGAILRLFAAHSRARWLQQLGKLSDDASD